MQDSRRHWYYATFMGSCPGINFANTLAFNTQPMGTFDRWSTVIVPRQGSCALRSVVATTWKGYCFNTVAIICWKPSTANFE